MEIVKDVNVSKLPVFNLDDYCYNEFLWEKIFDDGEYTDNGCDEAVGFSNGRSCSAEYYENTMIVRFTKAITDENLFLRLLIPLSAIFQVSSTRVSLIASTTA